MPFDPSTAKLSDEGFQGNFDPSSATEYRIEIPKSIKFGSKTGGEEYFRMMAPSAQEKLITAAEDYYKKTGKPLQVNSAFRSEEEQKRLYDESVKAGRPGRTASGMPIAQPGTSQHMGGFAIDIQQGKGDKLASEILSKHGFSQPHSNDPVHFEFNYEPGQIAPPAPRPTVAQEAAIAKGQPMPPKPVENPPLVQALMGARQAYEGFRKGATAGLSTYGDATSKYLASKLPGRESLSYEEALRQTRSEEEKKAEQFPIARTMGETTGTLAALSAVPGGVFTRAGAAGVYGTAKKYTESPEVTMQEAAIEGAAGGVASLITGGVMASAEKVFGKIGESALKGKINDLLKEGSPASKQKLQEIFGPAYNLLKREALASKPTLMGGKAEASFRGLKEANKAWEREWGDVMKGGLEGFASRYATSPQTLQKYSEGFVKPLTTRVPGYAGAMEEAASMINSQALKEGAKGVVLSGLGGVAGQGLAGAGLGAGLGYYLGEDPLKYALGGAGLAATSIPAAKALGTTTFLNPKLAGAMTAGGQVMGAETGLTLADLLKRQRQ